jgi:hypothetical protein
MHTQRERFEILKSAGEFGEKICAQTRKSAAFSLVFVIFSRFKGSLAETYEEGKQVHPPCEKFELANFLD